jgi:hemerythrin
MEWIPWTSVLATGHTVLDTDHEHLVALFHQLAVSVKERQSKIACIKLLDKIIQHAHVHFAFEEQLMSEQNFPKTDQHTAEHARLIQQAIRYRTKFEADSPGSHISLIHFPEDWLTLHILTADKQFANFLCATTEN